MRPTRGRPRNGAVIDRTTPRVIKQPNSFWLRMQTFAEDEGKSLHAAMREALTQWVKRHTRLQARTKRRPTRRPHP